MQSYLIDTHCHLNYEFDHGKTAAQLVEACLMSNVKYQITIATDHTNFLEVQKISENFPSVFHTIGIHPHEASQVTPEILETMKTYLLHPKCVAVGEIGLDYYYEHSQPEKQKRECAAQLDIAREFKKPVVIHSRDAEEDLLEMLIDYAKELTGEYSPGVIHCFSGTEKFARSCLDLGFYISLSGIFTFKATEDLRNMVKGFPLDRLLVETDAPYLAPVPMRGRKCEPAMVKHTAMKLAEVLRLPFEDLARITSENAKKCFNLPI